MRRNNPRKPFGDNRLALLGPVSWEGRKDTVWQHRDCSTSGCTSRAQWMIAEHPHQTHARFACEACRQAKYPALQRRLWNAPEVSA